MQAVITGDTVELAAPGFRVITDQGDTLHTLRGNLAYQVAYRQTAINGLATRHGDRIVVENLIGNVHTGGNRGPNGENTRVEVGAVTQVLEDVPGVSERRLANPRRPLAPHLRERMGLPIRHPGRHVMAAYAAKGVAAFRHFGRGIVGAAGTEVRHALDGVPRLGE